MVQIQKSPVLELVNLGDAVQLTQGGSAAKSEGKSDAAKSK